MSRDHLPIAALGLALLSAAGGASASDWETTRKAVIDPLNTALHRHLPSFVKNRDLDAILGLYATDTGTGLGWDGAHAVYPAGEEETIRWDGAPGREPIRERYRRLLDLFAAIDRAELRIDRIAWRAADEDGY